MDEHIPHCPVGYLMARDWELAQSLKDLRRQINAAAPDRSTRYDGSIGDADHAKTKSEHNPDRQGIVRAIDITHDPRGGFDAHDFADTLRRAQDGRVYYVISKGWIAGGPGGTRPGIKRRYFDPSAHVKHIHVSVMPGRRGATGGSWAGFGGAYTGGVSTPSGADDGVTRIGFTGKPDALPVLRQGAVPNGWVFLLQDCLGIEQDGDFGDRTTYSVKAQQANYGLEQDAVVGPWTWVSLIANAGDIGPGSFGHSGIEVLQNLLGLRGSDVDRDFGPTTESRVRLVQEWAKIDVDGYVGADTRAVFARA